MSKHAWSKDPSRESHLMVFGMENVFQEGGLVQGWESVFLNAWIMPNT